MSHFPKPFFKQARGVWYVEIARKQHNLGPDKDEAFRRYHALMAESSKERPQRVAPQSLAAIIDAFLEWVSCRRAVDTYEWYGDGLIEVKKHDLHNRFQAIFVAPTFSHVPWYADHPTDLKIRQETYFINVVVPLVEQTYPARKTADGRLLLGFSKSGWGAWSLLLRHPNVFGRAAAWDAPMMMADLEKYATKEIFGNQKVFEPYRIASHHFLATP